MPCPVTRRLLRLVANLGINTGSGDRSIAPVAARIFDPTRWDPLRPVRVVLIGTDFEVRVWDTLLKIPMGRFTTYSDIARTIDKPKAAR